MHHGGDAVAHGSFVAPGRETRMEGAGDSQVWFVGHTAVEALSECYGNGRAPLGACTPVATSRSCTHSGWCPLTPKFKGCTLDLEVAQVASLVYQRGRSTSSCHVVAVLRHALVCHVLDELDPKSDKHTLGPDGSEKHSWVTQTSRINAPPRERSLPGGSPG